ncbi:hypothetical protein RI054_38g141430 [Pseudoscourfieldia marina]
MLVLRTVHAVHRLAKQMADNKEADAAARQLNNRRILHDLKTPLAVLLQLIKKLLTNPKDADMKLAFAFTELIKQGHEGNEHEGETNTRRRRRREKGAKSF